MSTIMLKQMLWNLHRQLLGYLPISMQHNVQHQFLLLLTNGIIRQFKHKGNRQGVANGHRQEHHVYCDQGLPAGLQILLPRGEK